MKFLFCIAVVIMAVCDGRLRADTVPYGTELEVRLTSEASSGKPSGTPVSAVIIAPVFVDGKLVIAAGTTVSGNTADAKAAVPVAANVAEQPATLRIQFTKIADRQGHSQALYSVVNSIDNARETVDDSGLIVGITQSQTFEARMDQGINKLANQYQGLSQILSSVKKAVVKQVDADIHYKPGVELQLKVTKAFDWSWPAVSQNIANVTPASALIKLVDSQPIRTVAQQPPSPSDLTNLMFLGTAAQLQTAFQEAGWFASAERNRASELETARAMIEDRGYAEAPMSTLFLEGNPPDLTFEKQNDTFDKRHHIRIWLRPQRFQGQQVWMGAATHDISITFSRESRSFTHGIDPQIDRERSKVVNDLLFTGRVRGLALADRSGIPPNPTNATGDRLITDGKIAVVQF